ncbi:SBP (S-ribonuclease binding protein) family protein [Abeliophyllum distichum]|uniref:SBP (S-ribonuclease binding protein) family protein n=1 Tax=Abeliophyllum distichum TaxID=126358 RepID=A0ABD1RQB1_9LAMI
MAIQAQLSSENLHFFLNTQLQNLSQNNQNLFLDNVFSHSLVSQIDKQRLQIDQFVTLQNDRLRLALEEQRKQQISYFLKKSQVLIQQKDEEIIKAVNRAMELEEFVKRMEFENQTWQTLAKENEVMVMSLKNTIENLIETNPLSTNNGAEDAESCCDVIEYRQDNNRRRELDQENNVKNMVCRSCNCRNSRVIILPCRHLSSCKECEAFLKSCPVCRMPKKASIEAFF